MWSYYGSKSIICDLYPKPIYDHIIEPFAGSARYSLKYFDRDVTLIDKYDVIVKVWHYLQRCSPKDILGLPILKKGMDLRKLNLSEEERLFLGLHAGVASISPRFKVSQFAAEQNGRKNKFKLIADQLFKIKHWNIISGSYHIAENQIATWFIDPPYQFGGRAYKENNIDYTYLATWCKERLGQAIVCENIKANWLQFNFLSKMRGANGIIQTEAIWTNYATHFNNKQQEIWQ